MGMLYIQGMSTCAVQEMVGIGGYNTPKEVLIDFCRKTIARAGDKWNRPPEVGPGEAQNKGYYTEGLGENYVFHGTEGGPKGGPRSTLYRDFYASKLAAYIMEEKLGPCYGGDPVINRRYHPDHCTRVFVWNPDGEALRAWWTKNNPDAAKTVSPKPPVVIAEVAEAVEADRAAGVRAAKAKPRPDLPLGKRLAAAGIINKNAEARINLVVYMEPAGQAAPVAEPLEKKPRRRKVAEQPDEVHI